MSEQQFYDFRISDAARVRVEQFIHPEAVILQVWDDCHGTYFVASQYNGVISFIRTFPMGLEGRYEISIDNQYTFKK